MTNSLPRDGFPYKLTKQTHIHAENISVKSRDEVH